MGRSSASSLRHLRLGQLNVERVQERRTAIATVFGEDDGRVNEVGLLDGWWLRGSAWTDVERYGEEFAATSQLGRRLVMGGHEDVAEVLAQEVSHVAGIGSAPWRWHGRGCCSKPGRRC